MKLSAFLLAPTAIMATTLCPDATIATDDNGAPYFCGAGQATNCNNYAANKDAFCGLMLTGSGNTAFLASVCCADDGSDEADAAHDVADLDTCGSCLENNDPNDATTVMNQWDGENCFNAGSAPVFPNTNIVVNTGAVITDAADCQMSCTRLEFYGTCWKRCGSRGWGVDPAQYPRYPYGGGYGSMYMPPMYGGNYGGGIYGGYYYGGNYGNTNNGYPYGTVPSVYGTMCADPARLENIEDNAPTSTPFLPPPFFGGGGMYSGMYMYGGMPFNTYGMGNPIYGRQQYIGSVGVGGVYGGGASIYGGSIYGGSAVYGGSVYGAGVSTPTKNNRCSATIQCSCDLDCCDRGDCCDDYMQSGCAFDADEN